MRLRACGSTSSTQMDTHAMRKLRLTPVLALLAVPVFVWADSGVGVDTWRANKLDPTGGMASQQCDEDGTTWLSPLEHRSPTGNLYNCPPESPLTFALSDWLYYGDLQLGYVHANDDRYALWNRYTDYRQDQ